MAHRGAQRDAVDRSQNRTRHRPMVTPGASSAGMSRRAMDRITADGPTPGRSARRGGAHHAGASRPVSISGGQRGPSCTQNMAGDASVKGRHRSARGCATADSMSVTCAAAVGDHQLRPVRIGAHPLQVLGEFVGGGRHRVVGDRIQRVEDEQRRGGVVAVGCAGHSASSAAAGDAVVVTTPALAGFGARRLARRRVSKGSLPPARRIRRRGDPGVGAYPHRRGIWCNTETALWTSVSRLTRQAGFGARSGPRRCCRVRWGLAPKAGGPPPAATCASSSTGVVRKA